MTNKKKPHFLLVVGLMITAACLCFTGCNSKNIAEYQGTFHALDTIAGMTLYSDTLTEKELAEAASSAEDLCRELENVFSSRLSGSSLYLLNGDAKEGPVKVREDLFYVIKSALEYAHLTDGAFDPTLLDIIEEWGIGTADPHVPEASFTESHKALRNYSNVTLDDEEASVSFDTANFRLDLGAIAKGYICDRMKELLVSEYGIESGLINMGGNVLTIGDNMKKGRPWNVGIADPHDPSSSIISLNVTDKSLVTSGTYQRYFQEDGHIYHHILDPFTAYPADTGLLSVSILTGGSMDADALSTGVFVLGPEKGLKLIEELEDTECILITEDGEFLFSKGAKKYLSDQVTP